MTGPREIWTRGAAIDALRARLLQFCGDEQSMCRIAAERGIFCRGFRRWDDHDFHRRWKAGLGESTHLSRDQMEQFANLWQLCEQAEQRVGLACDLRAASDSACRGWEEFSDRMLERFCDELLDRRVTLMNLPNDTNASALRAPVREINDQTN